MGEPRVVTRLREPKWENQSFVSHFLEVLSRLPFFILSKPDSTPYSIRCLGNDTVNSLSLFLSKSLCNGITTSLASPSHVSGVDSAPGQLNTAERGVTPPPQAALASES